MTFFVELLQNASLLLAISIVYIFVLRRWKDSKTGQILSGAFFGCAAIIGMITPLHLMPGVIFDGRSILISLAGLFGGPIAAIIGACISGAYRLYLGGSGAFTGVGVIFSSAGIGIIFHSFTRRNPAALTNLNLYIFGFIVHLVMLLWFLTLPSETVRPVLENISLPVILIYPVATWIVAKVFLIETDRLENEKALHKSKEKVEHLNLVLRAIRDINHLIVQETDQERLLKKACDILTKTRGYYNAWIAIMDESGRLMHTASSGADKNFTLLDEWLKSGDLTKCAQKALSQTGIVVTKDPQTQCVDCPMALSCADRAAYTVRLEYLEKIYGLMTVSIPARFADDKEEMDLFKKVARDISLALYKFQIEDEKSRAEISLGESEERHKKILESSSAGYWFLGPDKKTVEVNQALCDMLGYSPKEIIGRSPLDFADDENQEIFKHQMALIADTAHRSYEIVLKTKTNKDVFTHFSASTLFDKSGKAKGSFALVTDFTGRKQLEEQLVQAQKMEAIGTLAGGIAHDFNNILSPIIGYTEMVHMDLPDGGRAKANLEEVLAASERAKDLVTQILTFSRKTQKEKKPLNIAYIVDEVLKFMRSSLPSTIEIKPYVKKDCGTVMADYTQIHQVVMNLCTNAFHAMRKDGGILKVTLVPIELGFEDMTPGFDLSSGPHIKLTISDTGCGVEPEVKDRILSRISRPRRSGKEQAWGLPCPMPLL